MTKKIDILSKISLISILYISIIIFLKGFLNLNTLFFTYIAIVIFSLSLFVIDYKKDKSIEFWLFFLTLLYFLPWLFWGFDLTDESYVLSLAWHYPVEYNFSSNANQFSYLVEKLWMQIIGRPFILWERVGGATIRSLIVLFSFLIIKNNFDLKKYKKHFIYLTFFAVAIISTCRSRTFSSYNLIHIFTILIFLFVWIKAIKSDNLLLYFLSGIFFTFTLFSRITTWGIIIWFPLFSTLYHNNFKRSLIIFSVLIGSFLFTNIFLYFLDINIFRVFYSLFPNKEIIFCSTITEKSHSLNYLFHRYLIDTIRTLKFSLFFILLTFIIYLTKIKTEKIKLFQNKYLHFILLILFGILFYFLNKKVILLYKNSNMWIYGILAIIFIVGLYNFLKQNYKQNKILDFQLFIILLTAVSFLGSDNGLIMIILSSAIIFIFPALIFQNNSKIFNTSTITIFLTYFIVIGIYTNTKFIYRDYIFKTLDTYYSTDILRGIKSKKAKVIIIEDFTKSLANIKDLENNYVVVNKPNAFYLLSEKKPFAVCWSCSKNNLKKFNDSIMQPKYIIFSNRSMRMIKWDKNKTLAIKRDINDILLLKTYIEKKYNPVVYSIDSVFVLYRIKKH